jgi:hypothetical protein
MLRHKTTRILKAIESLRYLRCLSLSSRANITISRTRITGWLFDLYDLDNKSVPGWKYHGEERQRVSRLPALIARSSHNRDTFQWIIEQNDDQWTIRSVKYQKYLGFENAPKDGTPVVGLDKPQRSTLAALGSSRFLSSSALIKNITAFKLYDAETAYIVISPFDTQPGAPCYEALS